MIYGATPERSVGSRPGGAPMPRSWRGIWTAGWTSRKGPARTWRIWSVPISAKTSVPSGISSDEGADAWIEVWVGTFFGFFHDGRRGGRRRASGAQPRLRPDGHSRRRAEGGEREGGLELEGPRRPGKDRGGPGRGARCRSHPGHPNWSEILPRRRSGPPRGGIVPQGREGSVGRGASRRAIGRPVH